MPRPIPASSRYQTARLAQEGGLNGPNVSMSGYTRVSIADGRQDHDPQCHEVMAISVDPKRIYQDNMWGSCDSRPGLNACLAVLAFVVTLVVWNFDLLGRGLRHLVNTLGELTARGIGL